MLTITIKWCFIGVLLIVNIPNWKSLKHKNFFVLSLFSVTTKPILILEFPTHLRIKYLANITAAMWAIFAVFMYGMWNLQPKRNSRVLNTTCRSKYCNWLSDIWRCSSFIGNWERDREVKLLKCCISLKRMVNRSEYWVSHTAAWRSRIRRLL